MRGRSGSSSAGRWRSILPIPSAIAPIRCVVSTRSRRLLSLRPLARLRPGFRMRAYGQGARRPPAGLSASRSTRKSASRRMRCSGRSRPESGLTRLPIARCFACIRNCSPANGCRSARRGLEIEEDGRPSFAVLLTQSALRLAASPDLRRLRICPNCHWLFIDRSRNASRRWCDMLTCGNRAKAERHQRRHRTVRNQ